MGSGAGFVAAELIKLRGLPPVVATAIGTVVAAALLGAVLAASGAQSVLPSTVPFVQVGVALLGILAATSEHTGTQIRTTLAAMPQRGPLLTAKLTACVLVMVPVGGAAVAAASAAAVVMGGGAVVGRNLLGASFYLVLIGLLSWCVAVVSRSLIGSLVAVMTWLLAVSPVLAGRTEHARWLPDQAGRLLYVPDADAVLGTGSGTLLLLGWLAVGLVTATLAFGSRDA